MKRFYRVKNGKKGGRPSSEECLNSFYLPEFSTIILTETQYNTLLEKYGTELLKKALKILEDWLCSSPLAEKHKGKNNYAHFRSDGWVINMARDDL